MLFDFIVVGAGLTGSVVSNRLLEQDPSRNILLVEAGIDANNQSDIVWANTTNGQGGEFDWAYSSVPQVNLDNRVIPLAAGKGLGGGTLINGAAWVRGHHVEYDLWADEVDDERWSYEGQLPYMRKTEAFFTDETDLHQHGLEGNMKIQSIWSTNRSFAMREPLLKSWEALGIEPKERFDHNDGYPLGIGVMQENRNMGRRQQSSLVYDLGGITVLTETMVQKVIVSKSSQGKTIARGIELANGTEIYGSETILAGGSYRTPQLLMLSGVGPKEILEEHGIEVQLDQPLVGQNLWDHPFIITNFKVKDPSKGWAIEGDPERYSAPQYGLGLNLDFFTTIDVPKEGLAAAIEKDEQVKPDPYTHNLLNQERAFASHSIQYSGASTDGSAVMLQIVLLLDQSRGNVTISSADINDPPVLNTNYLSTEVDRYAARESFRHSLEMLTTNKTVVGREIIIGEDHENPLTFLSTDDEIDARIREVAIGCFHPGGTAAMGKVVDSSLRVMGVDHLHVVDASVLPHTISANLQVALYALAEQAAVIIGNGKPACKKH